MNFQRTSAILGTIAASALVITSCGSDNNSSSTSSSSASESGTAAKGVTCEGESSVEAEGSSAQANAMDDFISGYTDACPDVTVNYNPSGSGDGVKNFIAGQVAFAGSDSPLKDDEYVTAAERCGGNDAWNLPLVFGPVAIAYNLEGVKDLVLDGPALAYIFDGHITTWNDPYIAGLNPGVSLPSTKIVPVYRSDSSGTTDNFQKYLGAASNDLWTKGAGKEFAGGVDEGAEKSAGVVSAVTATPGSVTYVEWGYASEAKLSVAQIATAGDGKGASAVELSAKSAGESIAEAKIKGEGNDLVLDLDSIYGTQAAGAYPIVLATYEIVCSKGYEKSVSEAVKSFLTFAATEGQAGLADKGYVPLPDDFAEKLLEAVDAIA